MKKGEKMSDEQKEKIRKSNLGQKRTKETCHNIGLKSKGRPGYWTGKKLSAETREKLSESHKGYVMPASQKAKIGRKNEKHHNWKGDFVGYGAMHIWVKRWKGAPKKCEHCRTESAKKYEWANKDHLYKRVLEDYIRLCTSCHRKWDFKFNR